MAFGVVLKALEEEGFIAQRSSQRLDSTHILGAVARMSALECVRETLAVALDELEGKLRRDQRPEFWEELWDATSRASLITKAPKRPCNPNAAPWELDTDGAYISGRAIQKAKEAGWQLVGPAQPSASRVRLAKEYRIEAFDISYRAQSGLSRWKDQHQLQ